jgi:hypothetical protein
MSIISVSSLVICDETNLPLRMSIISVSSLVICDETNLPSMRSQRARASLSSATSSHGGEAGPKRTWKATSDAATLEENRPKSVAIRGHP